MFFLIICSFSFSQNQKLNWKEQLALNIEKSIVKKFKFDLTDTTGSFVVLIKIHKSNRNMFEIDGDFPFIYRYKMSTILEEIEISNSFRIKRDFVLPIIFLPHGPTKDPEMTVIPRSRLITTISKIEANKKRIVKPIIISGQQLIIKD